MSLTQGLRRSLQLQPDAPAVIFGDRRRTFREFGDRVGRFAAVLRSLGMRTGERVAMLSLNSDRYMEYLMAVPWAAGVLNPCNIRWNPNEIAFSLNDSKSSILIFDETFAPVARTLRDQCESVERWIYAGDGPAPVGSEHLETLIGNAQPMADAGCSGQDLAGIFYTGGTTGHPKGVMLSHANLLWCALGGLAIGLGNENNVFAHAAPMFHVTGFAAAQLYWLQGSRHTIVPVFTPQRLAACISRDRATDVVLVPTMIQMFVNDPGFVHFDLSSLRRILYGGSPISEALLERAMTALPNVEFIQAYGMTESTGAVTVLGSQHHTQAALRSGKLRSAGRAVYISSIKIIDPDGNEVSRGTTGEIAAKGPSIMLGYWEKPEATAAALRDGWLRTGDAGYLDDEGFLYVVDRVKDMIITGGENVYSAEVENAIARHASVAQCAVIAIPNEQWGESVHAVVVCKPGHSITMEELLTHTGSLLARYKCPRSMELVSSLPLSAAGKILKAKLRETHWHGHRAVN